MDSSVVIPLLSTTADVGPRLDNESLSPIEETRHPSFYMQQLSPEPRESGFSWTSHDDPAHDISTIHEFIFKSRVVYIFCIATGILEPPQLPYPTKPFILRYYAWLIQMFFISGTVGLFILYCAAMVEGLLPVRSIASSAYFIGMIVQNIIIYFANKSFQQSLALSRQKMKPQFYMRCFLEALPYTKLIIAGFLLVSLAFCGLLFDQRTGLQGKDILFAIIGVMTLVVPSTLISVGLMTFILQEQSITRHQIEELLQHIHNGRIFTVDEYFIIRDHNLRRNNQLFWCVTLMVLSTIWNTICGLVLAFTETKLLLESGLLYALFTIFYTLIMFGRQALIFVIILGHMGEVNQLSEKIPLALVRQRWNEAEPERYSLEVQRLSVLAACKECPLGSTIFGLRLTNFQVHAQVCLFVLAFVVSFLRSIFIASLQ